MNCNTCNKPCIKKGFQNNGRQRIFCKGCKTFQLQSYNSNAWLPTTNKCIITLVKEGCGIRSISRILKISSTTTISRIKKIGNAIVKPALSLNKTYEVDELRTFVKTKTNLYWIACAFEKESKRIVDISVGRRTKATLQKITDTLLIANANKIYTDGLSLYQTLIPKQLHLNNAHMINHVERFNLNLRTHLKRLARKSICFSKNVSMLMSCLKIYLWCN